MMRQNELFEEAEMQGQRPSDERDFIAMDTWVFLNSGPPVWSVVEVFILGKRTRLEVFTAAPEVLEYINNGNPISRMYTMRPQPAETPKSTNLQEVICAAKARSQVPG